MNECKGECQFMKGQKKKIELKDILWIDNDSEFVVGRLFFFSWKHIVADLSEH
jgi:hypothetical protein